MSDAIDNAIEALTCAIRQECMKNASEAREEYWAEHAKEIIDYLFKDDVYLNASGVGYKDRGDLPALTFYIKIFADSSYLKTFNPIDDVLQIIKEDALDADETNEMLSRSIEALQAGIDRLRAAIR